jgi:broad specificity phosphatase PhoE
MVTIIFESHATSVDNETKKSSGHYDVALSPLGVEQAKQLGERRRKEHFDAVFCSDLQRSHKTTEIAFKGREATIIRDARLREVDYGGMTRQPSEVIEPAKGEYVEKPFPNGESYTQAASRMKSFLQDLLKDYDGKRVLIVGHRATQYGLEHWINGVPLKKAVTAFWSWQPGWEYLLKTNL